MDVMKAADWRSSQTFARLWVGLVEESRWTVWSELCYIRMQIRRRCVCVSHCLLYGLPIQLGHSILSCFLPPTVFTALDSVLKVIVKAEVSIRMRKNVKFRRNYDS